MNGESQAFLLTLDDMTLSSRFFALQRILLEVATSSESGTDLHHLAQQASNLLEAVAANCSISRAEREGVSLVLRSIKRLSKKKKTQQMNVIITRA